MLGKNSKSNKMPKDKTVKKLYPVRITPEAYRMAKWLKERKGATSVRQVASDAVKFYVLFEHFKEELKEMG